MMDNKTNQFDIAIVGIGCRFPGKANSPTQFWELLRNGVDAITEWPRARFDVDYAFHPDPATAGKMYVRRGGTVEGIEGFDAEFFGISPREARHIDPQHRLLLEVAYEALDDAGIPLERISGTPTGVFVGISTHDYGDIQMYPGNREQISSYSNSGTATSIAANRVSYIYNLKGPSMTIDTACSSSLTAIHLACRSLRSAECSVALVGGAQMVLTTEVTVGFCKASMLSPNETCHAFDAEANGYVRSEGVGMVVLKRLEDALADGDPIYAVIAATAINQDGHTTGLTVPSEEAQADMLRAALERADLQPNDVHYIEAHGTGTPVGDPIEANAIGRVLGQQRNSNNALVIGSVKTNIGHLEAASGMAGLIKTALALHHREIPPSLHFAVPNPTIDFGSLGLRVPTQLEPWPGNGAATAGVNSFGFGGANAHVLLREAPRRDIGMTVPPPEGRTELLTLSARSNEALAAAARQYLSWLESNPQIALHDLCQTAALHRTHHPLRAAIAVTYREQLVDGLEAVVNGEKLNHVAIGSVLSDDAGKLAFVFGGMGPQWWGMGRQLMREEPVFRSIVDQCDELLRPLAGWSLLELLAADESTSRVGEPDVAQITNFAIQAALTELWKTWGVTPTAVIGHSAGGIAAAYVSGAHDLPQAVLLAYHRSRLQSRAAGQGSMLAVALSPAEAEKAIGSYTARVSLGAINSPCSCALTGEIAALESIAQTLQERGVFARMLQVTVPYHSASMDPIEVELHESLRELRPRRAAIGLVSDNTGDWAEGSNYDSRYWWKTVREPVRFAQGMAALLDAGFRTFVEVGPHPVLAASIREAMADKNVAGTILPSIRRMEDERPVMLRSLGALWTIGQKVNWPAFYPAGGAARIKLPSYPWQKERHWFESNSETTKPTTPKPNEFVHPLLGAPMRTPSPRWEAVVVGPAQSWLNDHVIHRAVVFAGAAYVEMALSVAAQQNPNQLPRLRDIVFARALFLQPEAGTALQTSLEGGNRVVIHASPLPTAEHWTEHASARIEPTRAKAGQSRALEVIRARCPRETGHDAVYAQLAERGLEYGASFRGIGQLFQGDNEAIGRIDVTGRGFDLASYCVHPAALDAAFQVLIGAASTDAEPAQRKHLFMPVGIESVVLYQRPGATFWSHARVVRRDAKALVGDIELLDDSGALCARVSGLRCQLLEGATHAAGSSVDWLYQYVWEEAALRSADTAAIVRDALVGADVRDSANEWSKESGWDRYYHEVEAKLNSLGGALTAQAWIDCGWNPAPGQTGSIEELLNQYQIARSSRALADALLDLLGNEGFLWRDAGRWRCEKSFNQIDVSSAARGLTESEPAYRTDVALMVRSGAALAGVLRGDADAHAALFGSDAIDELRQFYREAPASAYYNRLLVTAVTRAIGKSNVGNGGMVRILEVGGGTGGCTAPLLAALPADRISYTFTDITPFFVTAAKHEFGGRTGFAAQTFDLEKDLTNQGFAPACADIVIAANVLHATADLAQSLAKLRALLAPGGLLVLLEITRRPAWLNIIFGITEGWWKFNDKELRPDHPLLEADQWLQLLAREGFENVSALSDSPDVGRAGQTVFLAHTPVAAKSMPATDALVRWTLISDGSDTAQRCARILREKGESCAVVARAGASEQVGPFEIKACLTSGEDLARVFDALSPGQNPHGIVIFADAAAAGDDDRTADSILHGQRNVFQTTSAVLDALPRTAWTKLPDLTFVTAAAQPAVGGEPLNVGHAPLWGFTRVLLRERPDLRCQMIDLDREKSDGALIGLAAELLERTAEEEVAFRGWNRYVHRLLRPAPEQIRPAASLRTPAPDEPWHIEVETAGVLASLRVRATKVSPPLPELVRIKIAAAALNFRDVMLASGMIPTVATEATFGEQGLGLDCAGWIAEAGECVSEFAPGDEVIAIAPTALASFSNTRVALIARKPSHLSFEEAAAIPCAFVTAYYALALQARLVRGERVLIHAATGGVGLAAIQIARQAGAEIFATAGSPEKRAYLESLGIEHIMDSRTLDFADEILEKTDGRGVDVILNSIAGEAITRGIDILSPYGRFVEIGKRDIYADNKIGLFAFRKNLSFFAVDLDRLCNERPALAGGVLRDVVDRFDRRTYTPLPQHVFPASEVEPAMRLMAQAKHIGKIVLQTNDPKLQVSVPKPLFRADGTYLISGGLGGFGLATARWMVREGVRSLVLLGRSAPSPEALEQIAQMTADGARIEVRAGDVAVTEDVRWVLGEIRATMPPLRGIFHAAMSLDDAPISEMNWNRMCQALRPKLAGAWNLHRETRADSLDHFVLYSSIAAILGNPMQSNYSAANAFLDALAHHRRALGYPGLAVNWGVIADAGYVARHREIGQYLEARGYAGFCVESALETLGALMRSDAAQMTVALIDWTRLAASSRATVESPGFRRFGTAEEIISAAQNSAGSIRSSLLAASDPAERLSQLEQWLREKVGRALGISAQRLNPDKPLTAIGLDSLIAVELVTLLRMEIEFELPAVKLLQGLNVRGLAGLINETLPIASPSAPPRLPALPQIEQTQPAKTIGAVLSDGHVPIAPEPVTFPVSALSHNGADPGKNERVIDYSALDYDRFSRTQRLARGIVRVFFAAGARVRVQGLENMPSRGPFIVAANHLCLLDVPLVMTVMERPVILLADDWLWKNRATRWIVGDVGNAIFVGGDGTREEAALADSLAVLRTGGIIGLSPEGAISTTGELTPARPGIAYLASQSGVPVVLIGLWGHQRLANSWWRLRRPEVTIRIGQPISLPQGPTSARELEERTDMIMRALASLLPPEFRGAYA